MSENVVAVVIGIVAMTSILTLGACEYMTMKTCEETRRAAIASGNDVAIGAIARSCWGMNR